MSGEGRFYPEMTLKDAQDVLRELLDEGAKCPCCTQFAKVYRRKIHATAASKLIAMYRSAGREWFHALTVAGAHSPDAVKARYWGLLEEDQATREDGSKRTGWWRFTDKGVAWVKNETAVPKYAHLYDGRCLRLSGDNVTIRDALGSKFNYNELMAGI
jgi:hypothetical protein